ncbi:MAG: transcriptional regulator [Sulfolobus sp.]
MIKLKKKIIVPCESSVRDIIPAIRAILAEQLINKGYSQKHIAELLDISVAEVNYLIKGKRGDDGIKEKLKEDEDFMDLLNSFVNKLLSEEHSANSNQNYSLCTLCSYARRKVLKQEPACPYDL